ncbi:hypothetical protein CTI12_AA264170 [Artemisia annua]|uniref:Homologous recombination OB-fold protein OB-fold domain-containing protein n=1 Tax=Artemisia annua TaxID=35608 RepID=A0A2U1NEW9_ARTAN|nr:hypothetical protein CTI12_AA264170 [Artemisia annua]
MLIAESIEMLSRLWKSTPTRNNKGIVLNKSVIVLRFPITPHIHFHKTRSRPSIKLTPVWGETPEEHTCPYYFPAKLRKQVDIHEGGVESVLSTQEYIKKIFEDVGEDEDFNRGPWLSAIDYVKNNGGIVSGYLGDIKKNLNKGKLEQVIAIVKSCSPNVLGDLTVTLKDLSSTIGGSIHHKIVDEGVQVMERILLLELF